MILLIDVINAIFVAIPIYCIIDVIISGYDKRRFNAKYKRRNRQQPERIKGFYKWRSYENKYNKRLTHTKI